MDRPAALVTHNIIVTLTTIAVITTDQPTARTPTPRTAGRINPNSEIWNRPQIRNLGLTRKKSRPAPLDRIDELIAG